MVVWAFSSQLNMQMVSVREYAPGAAARSTPTAKAPPKSCFLFMLNLSVVVGAEFPRPSLESGFCIRPLPSRAMGENGFCAGTLGTRNHCLAVLEAVVPVISHLKTRVALTTPV